MLLGKALVIRNNHNNNNDHYISFSPSLRKRSGWHAFTVNDFLYPANLSSSKYFFINWFIESAFHRSASFSFCRVRWARKEEVLWRHLHRSFSLLLMLLLSLNIHASTKNFAQRSGRKNGWRFLVIIIYTGEYQILVAYAEIFSGDLGSCQTK